MNTRIEDLLKDKQEYDPLTPPKQNGAADLGTFHEEAFKHPGSLCQVQQSNMFNA